MRRQMGLRLTAIGIVLRRVGIEPRSAPAESSTSPALVHAPSGVVKGATSGGIRSFKGLPYALPPTGVARWKAPVPAPVWHGVRSATQFGPACYQPKSRPGSLYADDPATMSEDCLTLNIWTP